MRRHKHIRYISFNVLVHSGSFTITIFETGVDKKKTEDFSTNFSKKNMCCLIENVEHASFFFPNKIRTVGHFVKTFGDEEESRVGTFVVDAGRGERGVGRRQDHGEQSSDRHPPPLHPHPGPPRPHRRNPADSIRQTSQRRGGADQSPLHSSSKAQFRRCSREEDEAAAAALAKSAAKKKALSIGRTSSSPDTQ